MFGSERSVLEHRLLKSVFLRIFGEVYLGRRLRFFHFRKTIQFLRLNNADILDAGCGLGEYSFYLSRNYPNAKIVAVDISKEDINSCLEIKEIKKINNIEFKKASLSDLKSSGFFNLIFCVDVMEHVKDDNNIFKHFFNALKTDGTLVMHFPNSGYDPKLRKRLNSFFPKLMAAGISEIGHVRHGYNPSEIESLLRTIGFTSIQLKYTFGALGFAAHILFELVRDKHLIIYMFFYPFMLVLAYMDLLFENSTGSGILIIAKK